MSDGNAGSRVDVARLPGRTWQIIRAQPALYLLALLAAVLGGAGGVDGGLSPITLLTNEIGSTDEFGIPNVDRLLDLYNALPPTNTLLAASAGFLFLGLIAFALGAWFDAAIIAAVGSPHPLTVPAALREGRQHLLPVFLLKLLIGVSLVVPLVISTVSLTASMFTTMSGVIGTPDMLRAFGLMFLCLVPTFLLFVVVSLLFAWLEILAVRAAVLEDRATLPALRRGWRLLRQHWRLVVPLWLSVAILSGILAALLAAPLQPLASVTIDRIDPLGLLLGVTQPTSGGWVLGGLAAALAVLIAAALGAALNLFVTTLWTLVYCDLTASVSVGTTLEQPDGLR